MKLKQLQQLLHWLWIWSFSLSRRIDSTFYVKISVVSRAAVLSFFLTSFRSHPNKKVGDEQVYQLKFNNFLLDNFLSDIFIPKIWEPYQSETQTHFMIVIKLTALTFEKFNPKICGTMAQRWTATERKGNKSVTQAWYRVHVQ